MMPGLQKAAAAETAFQTAQREKILPGSANIFRLGSNALQSELQGQIPQDMIDYINRTTAQRTGGGFNLFTGGGQAPANFARNIGQTSYGIQQNALQQAPTWQQLANSFVVGVPQAFQQAQALNQTQYAYDALNTDINKYNTEGPLGIAANQYQNQTDQWQAGQLAQQQQAQQFQNLSSTFSGLGNTAAYLGAAYKYNNPSTLNASESIYKGLPVMKPSNNLSGAGSSFVAPSFSTVNLGFAT
jgi:hypothetical protein